MKDKEYQSLLNMQQSQLKAKDKELQEMHARLKQVRAQIDQQKTKKLNAQASAVGYEKINELESKLRFVEKQHADLTAEAAALKRIQTEQSKALEEIGETKNYPDKIRALLHEMRELRDKNKLLEQRLKTYEENKKKMHQKMLVVEDRCRDLKMKISAAQGKVLGIEGEEGKFVIDQGSLNNMSPKREREQDQNK